MQNESIGSAIDKEKLGGLASVLSHIPSHVTPEIHQKLESIREQHADWVWMYEAVDPMIGEPLQVLDLYRTAPTEFFQGVIGGILMMRQALALVTGREF